MRLIGSSGLRLIGRGSALAPSSSSYVLDIGGLTGALGAYSLRKLRSAYTGNCIRVRRASDNAEADIGFSDDWVQKSAVSAHCGSSDGFVVVFYDQSGNGNDVTASTSGNQFHIWKGSTTDWVDTIDTRPTCKPQTANTIRYASSSAVVLNSSSVVSAGVISGFDGGTDDDLSRQFGFAHARTGSFFNTNMFVVRVTDREIMKYITQVNTPSVLVTPPTATDGTAYISAYACNNGSGNKTTIRFNGSTLTSTSYRATPDEYPENCYITIGRHPQQEEPTAGFGNTNHVFQEGIIWLSDIGSTGCTDYVSNCKESSWYGSTNYV